MTNYAAAPASLLDRLPPHSREAEEAVLGAILRDPKCAFGAPSMLRAEDFYLYANQLVFKACMAEVSKGRAPELVAVFERLREAKAVEDAGGSEYLAKLYDEVPTGANMEYYAMIVRDHAIRRKVIAVATEAVREAHSRAGTPDELIANLEGELFRIVKTSPAEPVQHVRNYTQAEFARIDEAYGRKEELPGIATGFADLDKLTGGWREGMYVVGARPSVGKTAWMLGAAVQAVNKGKPAAVFSLEMSADQLTQRLLAMRSGVSLGRIRTGKELADVEFQSLGAAAKEMHDTPLFICDQSSLRVDDLAALTRRAIRQHDIGIVFLDYLQLLKAENPRVSRVEQLESISRGIKLLSRQCKIPVVCMAQLNRGTEDHKQPKLSDLKGSGAIEQDADDVYLLWRKDQKAEAPVWTIGLDVAKQRNGPVGEIDLSFVRATATFEDYCPTVPD